MAGFTRWMPLHFHPLLLLGAILPHAWCAGMNRSLQQHETEAKILELLLRPDRYNPEVRPPGIAGTNATKVIVDVFFRDFSKFDDQNMEYDTQITFREQWIDSRLRFNDLDGNLKYLTLTDTTMVWLPDVFFSNEKKAYYHNIVTPNAYIRIFPYGSVLFSTRISLTLTCPMNLKIYPHDSQVCSVRMASYAWTADDVVFLWKDGDPVQIVRNLHLPRFSFEKYLTDHCNIRTNTGEYSCLKLDLLLRREFHYYMVHVYLPSCMLVIMSWASFWLDRRDIMSRLSVVGTVLLIMAIHISRVYASVPQVPYTMAIDVWMGCCFTFVFTALLESTLVSHASRSDIRREMEDRGQLPQMATDSTLDDSSVTSPKKQYIAMVETKPSDTLHENIKEQGRQPSAAGVQSAEDSSSPSGKKPLVGHPGGPAAAAPALAGLDKVRQCEIHMRPKRENCCRTWLSKFPTRSQRIDVISRITFPLVFALFNFLYWTAYLYRE